MGFTKKRNKKRGKPLLSYTTDYENPKNKTRKVAKGGMLPVLIIENAPLIISGVGAAFNLIINWVIAANKTIDNYRAVEKLSTTVSVLAKKPKPIAAATKPASTTAASTTASPVKPGPVKPVSVKPGPVKPK